MNEVNSDVIPFVKSKKGGDQEEKAFRLENLADDFLDPANIITHNYQGNTMVYKDGVYRFEPDLATKLRKYLKSKNVPHNNNMVGNILPHIKTQTVIDSTDPVFKSLPFWTRDAKTNPMRTVVFQNGLLDIDMAMMGVNVVLPHSPLFVSMTKLNYDYDPSAQCPKWLEFLQETFEGDQERINLLQEFTGYSLIPDPSRQKMLVMRGVPRSGKGTVQRVITKLIGESNSTAYFLTSLAKPFGLGVLVGKLVAFVGEVNLQKCPDMFTILERLLGITGCDPQQVEYKHEREIYSVTLPTRFWVSCNEMPTFGDTSGALAERLLVLDFERAVKESDRRPNLTDELSEEMPGIFNWSVGGLKRLQEQGFTIPTSMKKSVNEARRANSAAYAFLQDNVVISHHYDPGSLYDVEVTQDDVFATTPSIIERLTEWNLYADRPCDQAWFFRNLKVIVPKLKQEKRTINNHRIHGYRGIGLKPVTY